MLTIDTLTAAGFTPDDAAALIADEQAAAADTAARAAHNATGTKHHLTAGPVGMSFTVEDNAAVKATKAKIAAQQAAWSAAGS